VVIKGVVLGMLYVTEDCPLATRWIGILAILAGFCGTAVAESVMESALPTTDSRPLTAGDCNGNGIPDGDETSVAFAQQPITSDVVTARRVVTADVDGDACIDELDPVPDDPLLCGDVDDDGCDDCTRGTFDPYYDGADEDLDGFCDAGDCDDSHPGLWHGPEEAVSTLQFGDIVTLTWQVPNSVGATVATYDLVMSNDASDFVGNGLCLISASTELHATNTSFPALGEVAFYLVRVRNGCPGDPGAVGTSSTGLPRPLPDCP
jgi:hypothetical protein